MTPTEAIETVTEKGGLVSKLNEMLYRLDGEAREIAEKWAILGQVGGQRDDHAAMLLARLRPHLAEIARFAATCDKQITSMVADPFGRMVSA